MGFTIDLAAMGRLEENIGKLAGVPSRASARVARDIGNAIDGQFGSATDPYGRPWKPHAPATEERWGAHPVLQLTQAMRSSVDVRPMAGAGVSITIDHPAGVHQTGWSGPQGSGPARPILPGEAMPPKWTEAIEAAVNEEFEKAVA